MVAEHLYKASAPGAESERTMFFYHKARVDGLQRRNETPTYMEEHFVARDDFLYFRAVEFAKRPKKFGPADATTANARPILVTCCIQQNLLTATKVFVDTHLCILARCQLRLCI